MILDGITLVTEVLTFQRPPSTSLLMKGSCVGKWDLGMFKWEYTPTYRGFDSFYGYYSAAEDYFNHSLVRKHSALDFRNNTKAVRDKNGVYSTNLFTEAIEQAIKKHNSDKGPFFIYAAYQSVYTPLEVPQKYINQQCQSIPLKTVIYFVEC